MGVAGVNITIGANTEKFKSQMAKAQASVSKFGKSTVNLNRKLKKLGKGFTSVGKTLSMGLTAPIVAMGALAVKAFEDQIVAERRLEDAIGGAAEALKKQAAELQKTTRFGDEATMAIQAQLATLGLTEKQILKLTPLVQDLSARTGKDLLKSAKEVTSALSTGATTLEKYGVELTSTNTLAENIDITIQGLTKSVGGQAEMLAGEGMGSLIQMQNAMGDLMEQFGEIIAEGIKPFVIKIKELAERFQELSPETKKMIVTIAGLAAAVGPLLLVLGVLTSTVIPALITGFTVLMGPIGLAVAAIAAIGAAAFITYQHINRVESAQSALNDTMDDAARSVASEVAEIDKLIKIASSENLSRERRAAAVQELQDKYPDYLKNLDLESIKSGTAKISIDKLKSSILKMAQARAINADLQQIEVEKLEIATAAAGDNLTIWDEITLSLKAVANMGDVTSTVMEAYALDMERAAEKTTALTARSDLLIEKLGELEKQGVPITPIIPDDPDAPKGKGKGKGKGLDVTPTIDANRKAFDKWAQKVLKGSKIITEGTSNVTEDLEWALIAARDFSAAWDETPVEILERQRTVLKSYIDEASDGGKIITEDIRKQIAAYNELGEKIDAIPEKVKTLKDTLNVAMEDMKAAAIGFRDAVAGTVAVGIGEAIGQALDDGDGQDKVRAIFKSIFGLMKQFGEQMIKIGIPMLFLGLPQGLQYTLGGIALVAAASFAIAQFAQGGLVFGETLGIVGEGRGITRSNPEVIAPLDKLQGMLGGGGKGGVTEFVLRGETLRAITNKVADNRSFTVRE